MRSTTSPPGPPWATMITLAVALAGPACEGNDSLPPDRDPFSELPPEALECTPNLDGRIDATEIVTAFGLEVSYLVSPSGTTRDIDVRGDDESGVTVWDWSVDLADDQIARLGPEPLDGKWYEEFFEPDSFVAPFDGGGSIETISRQTEEGLFLLGLASAEENPAEGKTLLIYDAPVLLLKFPIEPGSSFTSVGTVDNATFRGIPYAATDTYEVSVDAVGELRLPSFTFTQAHRIRTDLTVEPALGDPASVRQVSYFFECFGEIARATSQPNEPNANFTTAAQVRRLGF